MKKYIIITRDYIFCNGIACNDIVADILNGIHCYVFECEEKEWDIEVAEAFKFEMSAS